MLVAARRDVAVVWVEADSFRTAPGPTNGHRDPGEQLAGLGVPVCRVRAATACGSACARPRPSRWREGRVRRAWPDVALPLALYVALCAFVDWHVETLQDPRLGAGDLVPIVALALVPALAARTFGARAWWIALVPA